MKKILMFMLAVCVSVALADEVVQVTGVTAQQRYPWNGLVDIVVTLTGESNDVAETTYSFAALNSATQAALPISHITRKEEITGSGTVWTRRFVWDAAADVGAVKIDDVALTVEAEMGVQLWENGPYWATHNVGAKKSEGYGYYFWWGDAVGYKQNTSYNGWVSVKDGTSFSFEGGNCPTHDKDYSLLKSLGYIVSVSDHNLVAAHDAATVHLGAPWRMPTSAEMSALISNCDTTWTTRNGVYGRLVTGKGDYASKSIFLPAAGYGNGSCCKGIGSIGGYWSSTLHSGSLGALYLVANSSIYSDNFELNNNACWRGWPVRPLRGFAK